MACHKICGANKPWSFGCAILRPKTARIIVKGALYVRYFCAGPDGTARYDCEVNVPEDRPEQNLFLARTAEALCEA